VIREKIIEDQINSVSTISEENVKVTEETNTSIDNLILNFQQLENQVKKYSKHI
jgi:hypothetical protein